jgi:hypothetical protein
VEQMTLVVKRSERIIKLVKRYSSPDFLSALVLTSINDESKSVGEAVKSVEGKL